MSHYLEKMFLNYDIEKHGMKWKNLNFNQSLGEFGLSSHNFIQFSVGHFAQTAILSNTHYPVNELGECTAAAAAAPAI